MLKSTISITSNIDHIVIRVADFDSAIIFYKSLFSFVGWETTKDPVDENSLGFKQPDGFTMWITEDREVHIGPKQGYLDHLALKCESQETVNRAYEFCTSQKWKVKSQPQSYPAYGNFYGFAFEGPDELKIEFVTR